MNNRHFTWVVLTAASLLTPASVTVVRTEGAQHGNHAGQTRGPLPDAVRQATERLPVSRTYLPTLFVNIVGLRKP